MYNFSKKNTKLLLIHYSLLLEKQWDKPYLCHDPIIQERMLQFEKNILKAFGLPVMPRHILYLYNQANVGYLRCYDTEWLYDKMALRAEKYLLSSLKSRNYWMNKMFNNAHADPFEILPELNIPVNGYTLFLYGKIKDDSINKEQIMREFDLLKEECNISCIYLLCLDKDYKSNVLYEELLSSGLKYLSRYLHWYHKVKKV